MRNSGRLARWTRNGVPSATLDAIIIAIFSIILLSVEYFYDLAPQLFQFALEYQELEAKKLARHDPLTGLPNRRFFVETLGEVLQTTIADSQSAVLMLDLDGFK